jgi:hypothetical protein
MATPAFASEQKITLMLGGKFCEAYLGEVEAAVNGAKGDGWHCTGQAMN